MQMPFSESVRHYGGYVLALLATLMWSGNLIAARGLRDDIPPIALAFWRCVVAVVVIAPFTLPTVTAEARQLRRHWRLLGFLGLAGIAVYTAMVYQAAHTTVATNMSLLAVSVSVFILLIAWFTGRERLNAFRVTGSLVALIGVAVLVSRGSLDSFTPRPGDLWMLGATVIFAYYSILVRGTPKSLSGGSVLFVTFASALVLLLPAYLVEYAVVGGFAVNWPFLGSLIYVGVVPAALAYLCWTNAVRSIGAAKAGLIYYLLPLFTALLGYQVLDEAITGEQLASMALIIAGVALGLRETRKNTPLDRQPPTTQKAEK